MQRVLVLFSNPPGHEHLRLDREDKLLDRLSLQHPKTVYLRRVHASDVQDVKALLSHEAFDVIQFSGHGDESGVVLDRSDMARGGELVSAQRLNDILRLSDKQPTLVIALCCYSAASVNMLVETAPWVITAIGKVSDLCCLTFAEGFYERFFAGHSIQTSYDHAIRMLTAAGLRDDGFRLDRRCLVTRGSEKLLEVRPAGAPQSIMINMTAVADRLAPLAMTEEQLCHLLARKLQVHHWIFRTPRESCLITVGPLMFGKFRWQNTHDPIYCDKLVRLSKDVSAEQWSTWSRLLFAYNDLMACEYRREGNRANGTNHGVFVDAVKLFDAHNEFYLKPARQSVGRLKIGAAVAHLEFAINACDSAKFHLRLKRYEELVGHLEAAVMNLHQVLDCLQPREEIP